MCEKTGRKSGWLRVQFFYPNKPDELAPCALRWRSSGLVEAGHISLKSCHSTFFSTFAMPNTPWYVAYSLSAGTRMEIAPNRDAALDKAFQLLDHGTEVSEVAPMLETPAGRSIDAIQVRRLWEVRAGLNLAAASR